MKKKPAITLVTPVWNSLPYLKETVESVLAQSFNDWELILADDGSSDGSRDYLATLNDPRIRVIVNERNFGIFGNLNLLFRQATAPLTFILCADDYLLPDGLHRVIESWRNLPPSVAFLRFNFGESLHGSALTKLSFQHAMGLIEPSESDLLFFAFGNLPGNLSNVCVRTDRVREAGYFREDLPYAGDFEMWSRMGRLWPFYVTDTEVSFIRRHPGVASIHLNRRGELVAQQRRVVDGLWERLKERFPRSMLRMHAILNYDALQRDAALKSLVHTRSASYLRCVNEACHASAVFPPIIVCWIFYFLSGGGRWGRAWTAQRLLKAASLP